MAVAVDEELCKIPGDVSAGEGAVFSHVFIDWVAVVTIDVALLEQWEIHVVLLYEFADFIATFWLLSSKLVAWESIYLQSLLIIVVIDLFQLLVVALGQSSERCDIHKENGLFTVCMLSNCTHTVAIKVIDFELENTRCLCSWSIRWSRAGSFIVGVSTTTHICLILILKLKI